MKDHGERGLVRFWFEFDYGPAPWPELGAIYLWCPGPLYVGVTAFDYEDAIRIIRTESFDSKTLPAIAACTEDVDVSKIAMLATLPYSPPVWRGIWFPPAWQSGPSVDNSPK
jgi:hypothetical protein